MDSPISISLDQKVEENVLNPFSGGNLPIILRSDNKTRATYADEGFKHSCEDKSFVKAMLKRIRDNGHFSIGDAKNTTECGTYLANAAYLLTTKCGAAEETEIDWLSPGGGMHYIFKDVGLFLHSVKPYQGEMFNMFKKLIPLEEDRNKLWDLIFVERSHSDDYLRTATAMLWYHGVGSIKSIISELMGNFEKKFLQKLVESGAVVASGNRDDIHSLLCRVFLYAKSNSDKIDILPLDYSWENYDRVISS